MGNRSAKHTSETIVPDQDPLLKTSFPLTRRIVHADITRDFDIKTQVLGTGYSGAVRLAEHKITKQPVAVKQFSKTGLKAHRLKLLKSEVEVYLRLDHPNICRLLYAYESSRDVWLVMELCSCELYSRLCKSKVYCEETAQDVMRQMLQAINYLHSHNIVHRDLKLENWMYGTSSSPDQDRLKLIDFGFSEIMASDDTVLQMPCGTLHYTSPEVLSRNYSNKCDLWSMGVICYMLLVGRPPFRGSTNAKIARAIMDVDFPKDGRWAYLSADAQDFIQQLLEKDVAQRMNASEALEHPWLKRRLSPSNDIGTDVLKSLRTFAQGSHLRRAALTILAYSLTSAELEGLEQTFLDFDNSGRGTITLEQLQETMQSRLNISSEEVTRVFHSFDFAQNEEIQYTPFVAALLETRVCLHEDKVRAAFDAFDVDGKGYITADSLVRGFNGRLGGKAPNSGVEPVVELSKEEAEQWIREVDFKGNGVVTYTCFVAALMGKSLRGLPSLEDLADQPTLRMFDDSPGGGRPRGFTESFASTTASSSTVFRQVISDAILDTDSDGKDSKEKDKDGRVRSRSFTGPATDCAERVQIRSMACEVDERYFA